MTAPHRARTSLPRALVQVALLSAIFFACDRLARALHLPLPGNVIGALSLALLLLTGALPLRWFEEGAKSLLDHLALLFVPAAVLVMRVIPAVARDLFALTVIMVVSTFAGLFVAAYVASQVAARARKTQR